MKIQGVVFDFDGIIADSVPLWQRSEVKILASEGIFLTEKEVSKTTGMAPFDAISYWCSQAEKTSKSPSFITQELTQAVIELLKSEGQLIPGNVETLEFFKSKGFPIGIVSGSSMKHIKTILDKFDLNKYFNLVYSADFERFGKPHPGIYISACKKLRIDPLFSVAVEDSFQWFTGS
jgi:beta-phosphoglucomutase-like phosphatase (HAD superfamily)